MSIKKLFALSAATALLSRGWFAMGQTGTIDLGRLLGGFGGADFEDKPEAPRPLPEAIIANLREVQARYAEPCPFKPGDIVTPRAGSSLRNAGEPHIILEVLETPHITLARDYDPTISGSSSFGQRLDVRFAALYGENYAPFWGESWMFETYTGEGV